MTLTSYGYDGSLAEREFAIIMSMDSGGKPVFGDYGQFLMVGVDGYRAVTITPGDALDAGVLVRYDDEEGTAPITLSFEAPSGFGQWHVIVLRRDWSTNTSEVLAMPSDVFDTAPVTVPASLPSDFRDDPGVVKDQLIGYAYTLASSPNMATYNVTQAVCDRKRRTSGTSAERDLYAGNPLSRIGQDWVHGTEWFNTKGEFLERYYKARTPPNGWTLDTARPAGWYPVAGHMPMIDYCHLSGYNQSVPSGVNETIVTGIDNTTRAYWGNGSQGEPAFGIGYQGDGYFNIGLPGRWSFWAVGNYANTTSGTFRALGVRTAQNGLVAYVRQNAVASGVWLNVSGDFVVPAGGDVVRVVTAQDGNGSVNFHLSRMRLVYMGPN